MDKKVGVIKGIDELGRIVIPKDFRDRLCLDNKVEVVLTEYGVLIRNSEYELIKQKKRNGSKIIASVFLDKR